MTDETPRTDAATILTCPSAHFENGEGVPMVPMETARQLERELAVAVEALREATYIIRDCCAVKPNSAGEKSIAQVHEALAKIEASGWRP